MAESALHSQPSIIEHLLHVSGLGHEVEGEGTTRGHSGSMRSGRQGPRRASSRIERRGRIMMREIYALCLQGKKQRWLSQILQSRTSWFTRDRSQWGWVTSVQTRLRCPVVRGFRAAPRGRGVLGGRSGLPFGANSGFRHHPIFSTLRQPDFATKCS